MILPCGHSAYYEEPSIAFSKTETSTLLLLWLSSFCSVLVQTLYYKVKCPHITNMPASTHMKLNNYRLGIVCGYRNDVQTKQKTRSKRVQPPRTMSRPGILVEMQNRACWTVLMELQYRLGHIKNVHFVLHCLYIHFKWKAFEFQNSRQTYEIRMSYMFSTQIFPKQRH
jgi:hypothetical protein